MQIIATIYYRESSANREYGSHLESLLFLCDSFQDSPVYTNQMACRNFWYVQICIECTIWHQTIEGSTLIDPSLGWKIKRHSSLRLNKAEFLRRPEADLTKSSHMSTYNNNFVGLSPVLFEFERQNRVITKPIYSKIF